MMGEHAERNRGLDPIAPLIDYYAREMGEVAGRLMAALSLLTDLEDSFGWDGQSPQARDTVRYSRLLVASVLRITAAAQAEQGNPSGLAGAIDDAPGRLFPPGNGDHRP